MPPETKFTEPRAPHLLTVIAILGRLSIQRWANRWNHLLGLFLVKATRSAAGGAGLRRATSLKIILGAILGLVLLLNGFFLANTALLFPADEVAVKTDHLGKELVEHATYEGYLEAQSQILKLGDSPQDRENRAGWFNYVHKISILESTQRVLRDEDQSALADRLYAKFQAEGANGFAYRHSGFLALTEPIWPSSPAGRVFYAQVLGFTFCLIPLILVLLHLGVTNKELGQVEWSFEWLFSFPVPARTLFLSRTLTWLTNPTLWIFILPYVWLIFVAGGARWWSPILGLLATIYMGVVAGSISVLLEVILRKSFSLARLKNVQALSTVLGGICLLMYLTLSASRPVSEILIQCVSGLRFPLYALPTCLPIALAMPDAGLQQEFLAMFGMLAVAIGLPTLTCFACDWLTRDGLLQSGSSQKTTPSPRVRSVSRAAGAPLIRESALVAKIPGGSIWLTEFYLLCRDRNLLTQVLIFPLIIVAYYLLSHVSVVAAAAGLFAHTAALTYAIAAFILLNSAFPVLAREQKTLWLLLSMPIELTRILRNKAIGWAIFASIYALLFMGVLTLLQEHLNWDALLSVAMVLIGVWISSFLAVGLGALATDVSGQESRMRPDLLYLYILLAALFISVLYADTLAVRAAQIALTLAVTWALWRRVAAKSPYVLDPDAQPEQRADLLTPLAAVLLFFATKMMLLAALLHGLELPVKAPATQMWASLGAGVLVCWGVLILRAFHKAKDGEEIAKVEKQPFSKESKKYALAGVVCGISLLLVAIYFHVIGPPDLVYSNRAANGSIFPTAPAFLRCNQMKCLLPWFLIGSPLVHGYLFRALLLQQLARVIKADWAICLQALCYAVVETQDFKMALPLFIMGLTTGCTQALTRSSSLSVLTQVFINAILIWKFGVTAGM